MSHATRAPKEEINKERLAFTLYHILRELDPSKRGYLTPTRFNKIAYLIHKDIEKNLRINTGLPWYWYLYGSVVPLEYCPSSVYEKEELRDGEWRIFYRQQPKTVSLPSQEQRQILSRIEYWRDKKLKTDEAIDLLYRDVEIPFLREIKKFSDSAAHPQDFKAFIADKAKLTLQLDKMLETYPDDKLSVLLPLFLRFDNTIRVLANTKGMGLAEQADLIEHFRKLVLVNLRATLCENMPEKWISDQSEVFSHALEQFSIEFEEAEHKVFCEMPTKEDKTGYARKLMEISWQRYLEG